jgi:LysM repeat protein
MRGRIAGRKRTSILIGTVLALAPTVTVAAQTLVIQPGDTLSAIADQYSIPLATLARINDIADPNLIFAGQTLQLEAPEAPDPPAQTTHAVIEGETLGSIADQYGVTVDGLAESNGIDNPDLIVVGQLLVVPNVKHISNAVTQAQGKAALQNAELEFGLPDGLLLALAWQESGWNQSMVSDAGAVGITQVLPLTADWAVPLLVPDATRWDTSVTDNARLGAALLSYYLDASGGDVHVALAAYYQGWTSVQEDGIFAETEIYVSNILALQISFQ